MHDFTTPQGNPFTDGLTQTTLESLPLLAQQLHFSLKAVDLNYEAENDSQRITSILVDRNHGI